MKKFGLLGEKLGHSFSPEIHRMLGEYPYVLCEVPWMDLDRFMAENDLDGFNVTIPYKEAVIPYCSSLSDIATRVGNVNTVIKRLDGTYFGYNTDYDGFLLMMKLSGKDFRGKKALVLGSGGASKTVTAVLNDLQMDPIITVSRGGSVNYFNISEHHDASLIVNTTPVGMFPDNGNAPVDLSCFCNCEFVADIIYNPAKTHLLLQAEKLGITGCNGLLMLAEQARKAAEIFTGALIQEKTSYSICEALGKNSKNIILIGMPGCGKSIVGGLLAESTKRNFIDIDEAIESKTGKQIQDIFADSGEKYFRMLETEIIRNTCKQSSLVIATGGGVVTREENKDLLRQNSTVVFLMRDLADLPEDGRPVTKAKGVEQIYHERISLYRTWSDFCVENKEPQAAADEIMEVLKI